jgi:hypothetical protein
MATSYGNRPVRIRFEDGDSDGLAEFFDGSETGADGILVPRFSTTERNALATADVFAGLIIYNETDSKMQVYTGTDNTNNSGDWTDIGGGSIISDADGNTNIEIGATTTDEIDVDIAGLKVATFDAVGIGIETDGVGFSNSNTIAATATIPANKNLGLFGTVSFTGVLTIEGQLDVL